MMTIDRLFSTGRAGTAQNRNFFKLIRFCASKVPDNVRQMLQPCAADVSHQITVSRFKFLFFAGVNFLPGSCSDRIANRDLRTQ